MAKYLSDLDDLPGLFPPASVMIGSLLASMPGFLGLSRLPREGSVHWTVPGKKNVPSPSHRLDGPEMALSHQITSIRTRRDLGSHPGSTTTLNPPRTRTGLEIWDISVNLVPNFPIARRGSKPLASGGCRSWKLGKLPSSDHVMYMYTRLPLDLIAASPSMLLMYLSDAVSNRCGKGKACDSQCTRGCVES